MVQVIKVRNPRTGVHDHEFTAADPAAVNALAAELRGNQTEWRDRGLDYRIGVLSRWADEIDRRRDDIAAALIRDTGRSLISRNEVNGAGAKIRRWCRIAPDMLEVAEQSSGMAPSVRFKAQYVPYALAGIISPWNFPLSLALLDALPALFAGCAVIIKPSEVTPRFITPFAETIAAVPELAGVLRMVAGDGATGAAVVDAVDMVCFTGSVPTGRKVAEQAARRFIPAFLELGGKDPAVVLRSADLARAADAILRQALVNSGQVCLSLERIYVDAAIHDAFVDILVAKAGEIGINYPDIGAGHLGPLISGAQAEIIERQLTDAVARGARIRCGGLERHGGVWCRPTVLTDVTHDMEIMRHETFGPVLPVMAFADVDQAVMLANDSDYGLSAAVFAGSDKEAMAVAERLEAGGVSINDAGLQSVTTEAEKHSFKYSGLGGSRMGPAGLMRFFRKKALMVQDGYPRTMEHFRERAE